MVTLQKFLNPRMLIMKDDSPISREVLYKPLGRIDAETYDHHRKELMALASTDPQSLVIDMKDVAFIDSRGLGLLISILKTIRTHGGKLVLRSLNRQVDMLLELTETKSFFEISS
jgi:anti-sigma B factor antagonist